MCLTFPIAWSLTTQIIELTSPSSNKILGGGCFGYETLVTTGTGEQKLMRDLRIGDEVVSDETGSLTKFLGWLELNSKEKIWFLEIQTEDGEKLIMTETHIVFYYEDGKPSPTYIRNLRPGNVLVGGLGEVLTLVSKYAI